MTWKNHKLVSIAITYAIGLPLEGIVVVAIGSIIPDFIEFVFKMKHRGMSHFWGIYALIFLFATYHVFQQPIVGLIIKWTSFGCLLHLFEDSMSKAGIPTFPGSLRKIKLGELYITKQPSEFFLALSIVVLCIVIKIMKVYFGIDVWRPKILVLNIITEINS